MQELDPRVIRVGIEVNGALKMYDGLAMSITGTKYANANQDECEVKITNLDKATRDYILTETSPFNLNKTPKKLVVEAGRVSYGTSRIFVGDITSSSVSQPPDITITLKALTGNYQKGNVIGRNQTGVATLKKISEQVASDLGATLDFQASDKNISNYTFTGGSLKQVDKLNEVGTVDAYLDGNVLIVKDLNVPLTGKTRILNLDTGMIGIPDINEQGLQVKFLLDNQTSIGSALEITSQLYKAVNGTYAIYQLAFDIATRDTPFYYIASCKRI